MFTSWSEVSTPALLSIASVLMQPAAQRVLDAAQLGEAEVAALGDRLRQRRSRAVDAQRVVRLVADVGVALGVRLHVGADAAVVEQVDRRAQDARGSARRACTRRRAGRCRAAARTSSVIGTDFAVRGYTPPPGEISAAS